MDEPSRGPGWNRPLVWVAFAALLVLHHDWWYWNDATLVGGVLPIGLAYHMAFSLAAAALWASASRWAWPTEVEAYAEGSDATSSAGDLPSGSRP